MGKKVTINRDPVAAELSAAGSPLAERAASLCDSCGSISEPSLGQSRGWVISQTTALRWLALLVAVVPLTALWTASHLEPSTTGVGTHQQLGLPPCSMRVMFSLRCPGCGMTTSWAHFTRGQWLESIQVNVGGFLLAWFSLLVAFLALRTFWLGQLPSYRTQQLLTFSAIAIALVTLVNWTVNMRL